MKAACVQSRVSFLWGFATFFPLAVAIMLTAPVSATLAQSVDAKTVEAWLLAEWAEAAEGITPSGLVLRYAVDTMKVPSSEELAALRNQVKGQPDHPRRQELAAYEDRLERGPSRVTFAAYLISETLWRISMTNDYLAPDVSYWDTAQSGKNVWGMIPEQLTVYDADHAAEVGMDYHQGQMQPIRLRLNEMLVGNLAYGLFRESTPRLTHWDGDTWVARAVSADGVVCEWRGAWDSDRSVGVVADMKFIEMENGDPVLAREWAFSQWRYDTSAAAWVAGLVEYSESNRKEFAVVYLGAETTNSDRVARLAVVPDVAGEDPLRGKVTVTKVADFRADRGEIAWFDDSGRILQSVPAQSDSPSGTSMLRAIGLITLLGLISVFVWVRLGGRRVS